MAKALGTSMGKQGPGRPGLSGVDKVMRNLRLQLSKMEIKGTVGLMAGASIIRRDMDVTPPLIPILTGKLRASWFQIPFIFF